MHPQLGLGYAFVLVAIVFVAFVVASWWARRIWESICGRRRPQTSDHYQIKHRQLREHSEKHEDKVREKMALKRGIVAGAGGKMVQKDKDIYSSTNSDASRQIVQIEGEHKTAANQSAANQSTAKPNESAANQSAANQSTANKSAANQSAANQSAANSNKTASAAAIEAEDDNEISAENNLNSVLPYGDNSRKNLVPGTSFALFQKFLDLLWESSHGSKLFEEFGIVPLAPKWALRNLHRL
jgi:FtsZ-interacting cell division protein ZipA